MERKEEKKKRELFHKFRWKCVALKAEGMGHLNAKCFFSRVLLRSIGDEYIRALWRLMFRAFMGTYDLFSSTISIPPALHLACT